MVLCAHSTCVSKEKLLLLTFPKDVWHGVFRNLCCLLALVSIKDSHKAAVDLLLTAMLWFEVWKDNIAVLLVLSLA